MKINSQRYEELVQHEERYFVLLNYLNTKIKNEQEIQARFSPDYAKKFELEISELKLVTNFDYENLAQKHFEKIREVKTNEKPSR